MSMVDFGTPLINLSVFLHAVLVETDGTSPPDDACAPQGPDVAQKSVTEQGRRDQRGFFGVFQSGLRGTSGGLV